MSKVSKVRLTVSRRTLYFGVCKRSVSPPISQFAFAEGEQGVDQI